MNYTKGEWVVQADGESICRNGQRVAKAFDPEHPELTTSQTKANAHLIAAAPDMYEALKEARITLNVCQPNGSALLREINQALNKAEGK